MKPPKVGPCQGPHSDFDMFWSQLANIINMCHELVRLADAIDWCFFYKRFSPLYAEMGRPGIPTRLMLGLHLLKHMHDLSDEAVWARWICNP